MTLKLHWYPWVPLCIGALCAVAAIITMRVYIAHALQQDLPVVEPIHRQWVVVANQDLAAGNTLQAEALSAREVPALGLAPDTFAPHIASQLFSQRLAHPVQRGQPIQQLHLQYASHASLAAALADGTRAFTIQVNEQDSHAHMIQPGDKVDIVATEFERSFVLASAVEVIATGPLGGRSDGEINNPTAWHGNQYRTLTFAIDKRLVPQFERMQQQHILSFWLRPSVDTEPLYLHTEVQVEWIIGGQLNSEHASHQLIQHPTQQAAWL